MNRLTIYRAKARRFAILARRAAYMEQDLNKAQALSVKSLACMALMEMEISPLRPFLSPSKVSRP